MLILVDVIYYCCIVVTDTMVWYGMVWHTLYGMVEVCYGMVWYGEVSLTLTSSSLSARLAQMSNTR